MIADTLPGPIVTVSWLAAHLKQPNLVVLDASMKPAVASNAGQGAGADVQIPGTRVFNFDKIICDQASPLPHMMPTKEVFEREVRSLGINNDSSIVAYDRIGIYASPRALWMFKAMGHDQVAVLDGGFPSWFEAGLPCEPVGGRSVVPGSFAARPRPELFVDADHVAAALNDKGSVVLDARSEGRFIGREPEPRAGLRGGHMPNSQSLPFNVVLAKGRMRPIDELEKIFASKVNREQKLIFSCGSGVTSCVTALAAEMAGYRNLAVYDGSWSEWGLPDSGRPVTTDP